MLESYNLTCWRNIVPWRSWNIIWCDQTVSIYTYHAVNNQIAYTCTIYLKYRLKWPTNSYHYISEISSDVTNTFIHRVHMKAKCLTLYSRNILWCDKIILKLHICYHNKSLSILSVSNSSSFLKCSLSHCIRSALSFLVVVSIYPPILIGSLYFALLFLPLLLLVSRVPRGS